VIALDVTAGLIDGGGTGEHVRALSAALGVSTTAPPTTDGDPTVFAVSCPGEASDQHAARGWARRVRTLRRDLWWAQFGSTAAARAGGAQLLHCPIPLGPARPALPVVVTVHDLFVLTHPKDFRAWHRASAARLMPPLLRRATHLIAVSEATRAELSAVLGIAPNRISVIPNGVAARFHPRPPTDPALRRLQAQYALPSRFILTVGAVEPRKNLPTLLRALSMARARDGGRDLHLVHVGPTGWLQDDTQRVARSLQLGSAVQWLGAVPADDLAGLYNLATGVAYPSLREGFGLPVAEAFASGTAVLTGRGGALGEIAGDVALTCDVTSPDAVAEALLQLWTDDADRIARGARGPARAAAWQWPAVAARTRQLYVDVLRTLE
jgi:glycosyltransferase involved in cell wall biosynthesis